MNVRVQDWSGSAAQRRPQGTCRARKARKSPRCEWIPEGTPVMVRKEGTTNWKHHTTKVALQLTNTTKRLPTSVMFKAFDWMVIVAVEHIRPAHEFNGS